VTVALRAEVEAAISEAGGTVDALGAAVWARRCEAEGWPVSVTALHIALGLRRQASWLALALRGEAPFVFDWEATHALNARVAARGAPTREAVRKELHKGATRILAHLDGMGDGDLRRVAMTAQEHLFDVERVIRRVVLPHVRGHLASIRAAASD
jgi:hypothetical protein